MSIDRLADVAQHPSVRAALTTVRDLLGVDVAYATLHRGGEQILEAVDGDGARFGIAEGSRIPMELTYCSRILVGDLPPLIPDVRAHPVAARMPMTEAAGVGAFASVPLVLSDGTLHGTLCCGSGEAAPHLTGRDLRFLHVLARIVADHVERELLVQARQGDRLEDAAVQALLAAVAARDGYTGDHSRAVVDHAVAVARQLGLDERAITDVEHVALLHDVGKLATPDSVLHKPGPLDPQEWAIMREHPVAGARIVAALPGLERLAPAIRAEHERWDGGGYPDGLVAREIPIASRISLVCDAYHAMTSDRPYRRALGHEAAVRQLREHAATQFCPECVDALLAVLDEAAEPLADAA